MYVRVDALGKVSLEASDEFRAFELQAADEVAGDGLAEVLKGVAQLEGDGYAWVHEEWLVQKLLLKPPAADWQTSFDAMLRFAKSKGWVRESPRRIRAHIVNGC